jgi:T-complex protein 1 subunit beta
MDKILVPIAAGPKNKHINVTNDGATILRSMHVDNPAAKILIDISKTQDEEVGDGTTTVAVLAGELLREGEKLVHMKLHPQTIIHGWRLARDAARNKLVSIARDNSTNQEKFKEDLINIAKTTLSSKLLTQDKQHFAELAVEAVLRLKGSTNLSYIQVIKKLGGSIKESFLCDGLILEKEISIGCKRSLKNCRILASNTPMDYDKIKIYGTRVRAETLQQVQDVSEAEKLKMKEKVDKIVSYKPNVYINRQLIYDYPEQLLVEKGILVIEHADFEGIERISAALGAEILSTFDSPERSEEVLGTCDSIEEILIGEDKVIKFSGCKRNEACTIVLRGSSQHILDEAERSLHDALCVLVQTVKNKKVIYGGGNSELHMALACEALARTIKGKEALAIEGYARALRQLPITIAENAGFDANELIHDLEIELKERADAGINVDTGLVDSMDKLAITVPIRLFRNA